jgi:hypothetical protein
VTVPDSTAAIGTGIAPNPPPLGALAEQETNKAPITAAKPLLNDLSNWLFDNCCLRTLRLIMNIGKFSLTYRFSLHIDDKQHRLSLNHPVGAIFPKT